MSINVTNGKGNEWAVASRFSSVLEVPIRQDSSAKVAEAAYLALPEHLRERFEISAKLAVEYIVNQESNNLKQNLPLEVVLSGDSEGESGDVRDVLVFGESVIFGVSCKTNHDAYKHSRLSKKIDWVAKWGLDPAGCSQIYKDAISPVFDQLAEVRTSSGSTALFRNMKDLHGDVYAPVLLAFEEELVRLFAEAAFPERLAGALVQYVVGNHDFYKVVTRTSEVDVLAFNFNGSLNSNKTKLPTKVLSVDREEGSAHSINVRFDRGYVFNFRIHNASSRVEPSLKFDVQAVGLPSKEIRHHNMSYEHALYTEVE